MLPALPMGLLLSLSLGMGLFYVYLSYIEELIMYVVLCIIFYKEPKQMTISVIFSFVVAFFFQTNKSISFLNLVVFLELMGIHLENMESSTIGRDSRIEIALFLYV